MSAPQLTVQVQGQTVVSADQLNTFEQTADNVSQLRAFVGTTGVQVDLRGYATPGDGGGGPFYWALGSATDNGTTIVVPSGAASGYWLRLGWYSAAPWLPASLVAALPAASSVPTGTRGFVTNASATAFASIVAGGGANSVPVFSDGANWRIG